jgi:hypothetical protein
VAVVAPTVESVPRVVQPPASSSWYWSWMVCGLTSAEQTSVTLRSSLLTPGSPSAINPLSSVPAAANVSGLTSQTAPLVGAPIVPTQS